MIEPHYKYLSAVNNGIPQAVAKTHREMLDLLRNDWPQLHKAIHEFAKKCQDELSSTTGLVEDLKKELTSDIHLYGKVAGLMDQEENPELEVVQYLLRFGLCFTRLEKQFDNETNPKALKKDVLLLPKVSRNSPVSEPNPGISPESKASDPSLSPPVPPSGSRETPAANLTSFSQPEFPLPEFLEPLKLKAGQKKRIRNLLEFIDSALAIAGAGLPTVMASVLPGRAPAGGAL